MNRTLFAFACATVLATGTLGARAEAASNDVAIETNRGTIVVRLDVAHAPITAGNFLRNVDAHRYDGGAIYRNVTRKNDPAAPFEVIQGGLGPTGDASAKPIALEPTSKTGLHNVDGAIAMARTSDPDSATTEFFIDLGDARYLDAGGPLDPGYAAFGRVVRGMAIVRAIHAGRTEGDHLVPPVRIVRMRRL